MRVPACSDSRHDKVKAKGFSSSIKQVFSYLNLANVVFDVFPISFVGDAYTKHWKATGALMADHPERVLTRTEERVAATVHEVDHGVDARMGSKSMRIGPNSSSSDKLCVLL